MPVPAHLQCNFGINGSRDLIPRLVDFLPFDTAMNDNPTQALQAACEAGHEADLLRLLHTHKHSPALQLLNSSCLSLAARGGHLGIVEILLHQNDYLPPAHGQVGCWDLFACMCRHSVSELVLDTYAADLWYR